MFSSRTRLKLVIVVIGLLTFASGMRADDAMVRWVGVALVAVAWLLRFARGPAATEAESESPTDDEHLQG